VRRVFFLPLVLRGQLYGAIHLGAAVQGSIDNALIMGHRFAWYIGRFRLLYFYPPDSMTASGAIIDSPLPPVRRLRSCGVLPPTSRSSIWVANDPLALPAHSARLNQPFLSDAGKSSNDAEFPTPRVAAERPTNYSHLKSDYVIDCAPWPAVFSISP